MNKLKRKVVAMCLSLVFASSGVFGEVIIADDDLVGTIWASDAPYGWTNVDGDGNVAKNTSNGFYIEVLEHNDGVFVIKLHWWNESSRHNVIEYGVMVTSRENSYLYQEAGNLTTADYPGIRGEGFFRITGENSARIIQIGHTADGNAAALVTDMTKVDQAPTFPVPQSHPAS